MRSPLSFLSTVLRASLLEQRAQLLVVCLMAVAAIVLGGERSAEELTADNKRLEGDIKSAETDLKQITRTVAGLKSQLSSALKRESDLKTSIE